jgi:hypothetical protein
MPVNAEGATRPRQQLRTTNQGFSSVFGFFFFDRSSNGKGNYRRSIFQQTDFVGDAVGKNVTDKCSVLHRRNESVGKTV